MNEDEARLWDRVVEMCIGRGDAPDDAANWADRVLRRRRTASVPMVVDDRFREALRDLADYYNVKAVK